MSGKRDDGRRVALGPVISPNQVETIQHIVDDAVARGAMLLAGGKADGLFYPATVLAGITPDMLAFREELFGPVACIMSFAGDAEAVRIAQDNDYGLSAGILSASTSRAMATRSSRAKKGFLARLSAIATIR